MNKARHTVRGIAQVVAVLPRLLGYTPVGRVTVLCVSEAGAVRGTASLDAADCHGEPLALLSRFAQQSHQDGPLARVLVIGWRGSAPVRQETTTVADDLILAGHPVEGWLTDGRSVHPLGAGDREPVASLVGPLAQVGAEPATDRDTAARQWRPSGQAVPERVAPDQAWASWRRVVTGEADETDAARAAGALTDPLFRDQAFAAMTGLNSRLLHAPEGHALAERRVGVDLPERLRRAVTLLAPVPDAVHMVALSGWVAYLAGGGAGVTTLLEVGHELDPSSALLGLLEACYSAALDPARVMRDLA